ncbi:ATP-binding cassette domain-containing protein [bacterium]|nr:ATP-binding cassette domain-containing protein [bacterium]
MILLSARDLGRHIAGDPIFQGLEFELRTGERVGLVGPNGVGKTTLLKVLTGQDKPDYGQLYVRSGVQVSLLRQQPDFGPTLTLRDVARSALAGLVRLQEQLHEAAEEIAGAESDAERDAATARYAQIHDQLEHHDAFAIEHRIEEVLFGLGFAPIDLDRPAATFSGGQQSRIMLAKLLLENPDVMLLDEPSNHLDLETVEWLEAFLARQSAAMIVVSHDRQFLDRVVNTTWELHRSRMTAYPGNFSKYWKLRQERMEQLEKQYERQQDYIAETEAFIRKNMAGQKTKQAQDRQKKLARLERIEKMSEIVGPVMGFDEVTRTGDVVIEATNVSKSYDKTLFDKFTGSILRGQCVGVIGPNGAGKSTLVKILIGKVPPDSGTVRLGAHVKVGYYDQGLGSLPPETTLIRAVWPEDDLTWIENDVRDLIARFGLTGDMAFQKVGQLSGGEKGKAALARLCATNANLFVLDEPTNHLDIWSCESLERSIQEFEGTVIVVSHDRYFLNQVADRLIVVADGKARLFEGNYEAWEDHLAQEKAREEERQARAAAASAVSKSGPSGASSSGSGPQPKKKRKFPFRKTADLEADIAKAEALKTKLEADMADPATYRDEAKARKVREDFESTEAKLAQLYDHWEEAVEWNS